MSEFWMVIDAEGDRLYPLKHPSLDAALAAAAGWERGRMPITILHFVNGIPHDVTPTGKRARQAEEAVGAFGGLHDRMDEADARLAKIEDTQADLADDVAKAWAEIPEIQKRLRLHDLRLNCQGECLAGHSERLDGMAANREPPE